MGTRLSGPAMLASDPSVRLQEWLEQHPPSSWCGCPQEVWLEASVLVQGMGTRPAEGLVWTLLHYPVPELLWLQVLSVETALSIQSHPDKKLAERLHAQQPHVSSLKQACQV